jgi:uncharacterized protein
MKISVNDITDQETELAFSEDDAWVNNTVALLDEHKANASRKIDLSFKLRKVDEVIIANGTISTNINVLCSRCTLPHTVKCDVRFSTLFCEDPELAGVSHIMESGKPAGQIHGYSRHEHDASNDESDLDISYLTNDSIDLADILSEQLRLRIPLQPLCKETCKGICPQCGTDLNMETCECKASISSGKFAALANFNVNRT